jgi:hypothetical protein
MTNLCIRVLKACQWNIVDAAWEARLVEPLSRKSTGTAMFQRYREKQFQLRCLNPKDAYKLQQEGRNRSYQFAYPGIGKSGFEDAIHQPGKGKYRRTNKYKSQQGRDA